MTRATDPQLRATGREARVALWRRRLGLFLPVAVLAVLVWAAFEIIGLRVVRVSRSAVPLRQADAPGPAVQGPGPPSSEASTADADGAKPRNIILVIADGLGFAHLTAARTTLHGISGPSVWDRFSHSGWQRTHPVAGFLTDSGAAATALATGHPANYAAMGIRSRPSSSALATSATGPAS